MFSSWTNLSLFKNPFLVFRVYKIMKSDSEKDPATDPNALLAKLLIGQVGFSFSKLHSKSLVLEISDYCFLIF